MHVPNWPSSLYRDPSQFWSLIILSTAVYGIVPLGSSGRSINLSLFDLMVIILLVIVIRDRAVRLDRIVVSLTLGALAIVIIHSASFFLWVTPADHMGMARETVKTAAFFLELLILAIVMVAGKIGMPPPRTLAILFTVLAIQAVALHFRELYGPMSWFLPRNQHLATLSGIVVLGTIVYSAGNMSRHYLLIGLFALIAVVFLLLNKTYLVVTVLMLALLPFINFGVQRKAGIWIVALAASFLIIIFAIFFSSEGLRNVVLFERLDTISISLGFRTQLWAAAGEAAAGSFPIGIGLGQFASYLAAGTNLVEQNLRFIHNTPLALVTELGFVGVILGGMIVTLIIISTRGLPLALRIVVWVCVGLPMLLHDALGLRMIPLVLAAGMAGAFRMDRP